LKTAIIDEETVAMRCILRWNRLAWPYIANIRPYQNNLDYSGKSR